MITLLIGLAVEVFAGAAALHMPKRKGRSPLGWAVAAFLVPLLLLVLVCLRGRAKSEVGPSVISCSACGGAVSVQAAACPHCGQPQKQMTVRPWYAGPVEIAGTAIVLGSIIFGIW